MVSLLWGGQTLIFLNLMVVYALDLTHFVCGQIRLDFILFHFVNLFTFIYFFSFLSGL